MTRAAALAWAVCLAAGCSSAERLGTVQRAQIVGDPQGELTSDGGVAGDLFGSALALAGDTAVVGAYHQSSGRGASYVFARAGSSWALQQELAAADGVDYDYFGSALALSDTTIVIGADGVLGQRGAAYVFDWDGTAWVPGQKLTAADANPLDYFGLAVAATADTIAVGAPGHGGKGAAYVFAWDGTSWGQTQVLTPASGDNGQRFGNAVAVDGDTLLVGAPQDGTRGTAAGAAYLFVRAAGTWSTHRTLAASDAAANDTFGAAVALAGGTAAVGAPGRDSGRGAVYVYVDTDDWATEVEVAAPGAQPQDGLGGAVALSGDTLLAGASGGAGTGAAHVFARGDGSWPHESTLAPADGVDGDLFGDKTALAGDTALIGAPNAGAVGEGAAYVYVLRALDGGTCDGGADCGTPHDDAGPPNYYSCGQAGGSALAAVVLALLLALTRRRGTSA